jgi:hypothetical protein
MAVFAKLFRAEWALTILKYSHLPCSFSPSFLHPLFLSSPHATRIHSTLVPLQLDSPFTLVLSSLFVQLYTPFTLVSLHHDRLDGKGWPRYKRFYGTTTARSSPQPYELPEPKTY